MNLNKVSHVIQFEESEGEKHLVGCFGLAYALLGLISEGEKHLVGCFGPQLTRQF